MIKQQHSDEIQLTFALSINKKSYRYMYLIYIYMVNIHQQQQQQRLRSTVSSSSLSSSSSLLRKQTMLFVILIHMILVSFLQQILYHNSPINRSVVGLVVVEGTTVVTPSLLSSLLRIRNNTVVTTTSSSSRSRHLNQQHSQQHQQRQLSPSIGTFRMLVLLVQFTDQTTDRTLPPKTHFEDLCTNHWIPYFQQQSYTLYNIAGCDVYDWMQTDNTEAYYSQNAGNLVGSDVASAMFLPVLRQIDNNGIDFTQYDVDLDLTIDSLLVIHSGYASEQGSGSDCNANPPQNRIVSQGHVGSSPSVWTSNNGLYNINGYAIASAFDRVCPTAATWSTWGVAAHEKTHTFGTPDIYDLKTRLNGGGSGFLGGTGLYDIMSNPFGPASDGNAGGMSSFIKEITGWVQPIEIQYDGTYTIRALNDYGDVYKITKGYGTDEYLLIENRQNIGYDAGLPGSGLLIYHIDKAMEKQDRAGFPTQSGWPTNGNHYRCAILQADGKYDLEQGMNNGDAGDYWTQGMTLGPGNGQTYPNTDSYQNGNVVSTGITITDISASGASMTFRVSGLGTDPNGGSVSLPTSPGTSPPVTSPPVTSPPMTSPPTTPSPVTSPPTTPSPTTSPPTTPSPTTSAPIMPTTSYPTTTQPVVTAPPASFPPTPSGNAVVLDPTNTPTQNSGGSAALSDLSFVPSSVPSHVPIATTVTIKPSFFSANLESTVTSSAIPPRLYDWYFVFITFASMTVILVVLY
jgi:M6 family metalloprotease-like protein